MELIFTREDKPLSRPFMRLLSKFAVLLLAAGLHASAQEPQGELITPAAVAVDATLHRAFAVDTTRNRVLVYDEQTAQQKDISVGHSPIGLAIDQQAHRVYVVNAGSGNVSVIDARSSNVLATLATDSRPYAIAVDSATHHALVSNTFSNKLTVVDGMLLASEQKPLGSKDAIAVDAQHGEAFLIGYEDPSIAVISTAGALLRKLPARIHLWGLAVDAPHRMVYATAIGDHALEVLNTATGERTEIAVGGFPCAVALSSDGLRAYVANREDGTVTVVDTARRAAIATIKVGGSPQAVAVDTQHHRVAVANTASGTVTLIDTNTNSVVRTVPAGPHPYSLALDEERGEVFAVGFGAEPLHHFGLE